jgi:hypothetical protein
MAAWFNLPNNRSKSLKEIFLDDMASANSWLLYLFPTPELLEFQTESAPPLVSLGIDNPLVGWARVCLKVKTKYELLTVKLVLLSLNFLSNQEQ